MLGIGEEFPACRTLFCAVSRAAWRGLAPLPQTGPGPKALNVCRSDHSPPRPFPILPSPVSPVCASAHIWCPYHHRSLPPHMCIGRWAQSPTSARSHEAPMFSVLFSKHWSRRRAPPARRLCVHGLWVCMGRAQQERVATHRTGRQTPGPSWVQLHFTLRLHRSWCSTVSSRRNVRKRHRLASAMLRSFC